MVTSVQTPHEQCDISPVKTCNLQTKLLPRLEPVETCSEVGHVTSFSWAESSSLINDYVQVTRPVCHTTWVQEVVTKPLMVRWCMEEEVNTIEDNGPLLDDRLLWEDL